MLTEKLANIPAVAENKLWKYLRRPLMLTAGIGGLGYLSDVLTDPSSGDLDVKRFANTDEAIASLARRWTNKQQRNNFYDFLANSLNGVRSLDEGAFYTGRGLHSYVRSFANPNENYKKRFDMAINSINQGPVYTRKALGNLRNILHAPLRADGYAYTSAPLELANEAAHYKPLIDQDMKNTAYNTLDNVAVEKRRGKSLIEAAKDVAKQKVDNTPNILGNKIIDRASNLGGNALRNVTGGFSDTLADLYGFGGAGSAQ